MDPASMVGAITGAASAGIGLWKDLWGMKRQDDYKEWLAGREDTAVQRRAADLEAAGLSKTLAAGSAANSGAVSISGPNGGQMADALAAAANVQGIKNAQQENANMKKSYQVMNSQIDQNYADMMKKNAEANYFNAMANKSMIDGQLSSYLGLKALQDIEESKERSKGYKYQRNLTDTQSELNVWHMLREATELDLIQATGQNSSVGGVGSILRLPAQLMNNLLNTFKVGSNVKSARNYRYPKD